MKFNKNGIIQTNAIITGTAGNILTGTKYTDSSWFIVTGTSRDIYKETDVIAKVDPSKKYYLTGRCSSVWAGGHPGNTSEGLLWLYFRKTYNKDIWGYDSDNWWAYPYESGKQIAPNVWKVTVPEGAAMARIRCNTYSKDGSTQTVGFWGFGLFPEEDFTPQPIGIKIGRDKITSTEIIEY